MHFAIVIYFNGKPRVSERWQVKDHQSHISVYVVCLTYLNNSWEHQPRHANSIWSSGERNFVEQTKRHLYQYSQCKSPNPIKKRKRFQVFERCVFFKKRSILFLINSARVIRLVKQKRLSFSSIKINKPLVSPVYIVI